MKFEWTYKIKEEITNQLDARFLEVIEYPIWLANIVLMLKKDDKVRMYIDFWDLNKACPKNDY